MKKLLLGAALAIGTGCSATPVAAKVDVEEYTIPRSDRPKGECKKVALEIRQKAFEASCRDGASIKIISAGDGPNALVDYNPRATENGGWESHNAYILGGSINVVVRSCNDDSGNIEITCDGRENVTNLLGLSEGHHEIDLNFR